MREPKRTKPDRWEWVKGEDGQWYWLLHTQRVVKNPRGKVIITGIKPLAQFDYEDIHSDWKPKHLPEEEKEMLTMNGNETFRPVYKDYSEIPILYMGGCLIFFQAKYFHNWEVPCRCGCRLAQTNGKLIHIMETARTLAGFPFPVTSWNRCWDYNKLIGGDDNSSHPEGYAIDIGISDPSKRFIAVSCLITAGAPRIKLRPDHIHVDIHPDKKWGVLLL